MDFMTKGNQFSSQQQPQTQLHHSVQYNIRNNLLNGNIGNIDITKETPIDVSNNNNFIQNQQFQNYNNIPVTQQPPNVPFNNNYNSNNIQPTIQYRNKPMPTKQEKRTHSLNQKSITNFFKGKNHSGFGFGTNKSKKQNHSNSYGGKNSADGDDDDDVFIDDPNSSTLTFHDIQKYGFKNGDKLNVTEDTTPLIPTLVTKQTSNMTNTEYRKFLNTQKKNVLNALNNQNKLSSPTLATSQQNMMNSNIDGFSNNQLQSRAMSLQNGYNSGNPYLMQRQQQFQQWNGMSYNGVNQSNSNIPNTVGPRANSLMTGGIQHMRYFNQQQHQGNNIGYPRTMSLTNNPQQPQNKENIPNNPYKQQQFINNRPDTSDMNQQMQSQYRTMSLQQGPTKNTQQFVSNTNTTIFQQSQFQPSPQQSSLQQQQHPQQLVERQVTGQKQSQHQLQQQDQISIENDSINNKVNTSNNIINSNVLNINDTLDSQKGISSANISQTNNGETNIPLNGVNSLNIPSVNEEEEEQRNKQILQINPNINKPKLNIIKLSKPKQEELLQKENIANDSIKEINQTLVSDKTNQKNSMFQEPDLRPSSLLQEGLNSLSLNDNNARDSTITQVSSFSVSPIKQQEGYNQSIYKLANGTDSKAFVTAEEFPSLNYNNNITYNINEINRSTIEAKINSRRISAIAIAPASKRISIYKNPSSSASSASSTVSEKLNKTGERIQETSPSTVTASKTDANTDRDDQTSTTEVDTANIDDAFAHKSSPTTPTHDTVTPQSKDKEKNSDNFVFDNTLYSPYEDITQTAPKILYISKDQMGLLNENKRLMKELTLLSTELAESIKRETLLEDKIQNMKQFNEFNNQPQRNSTISTSPIAYTDFETELRRKSSKIVELIQALNEERMKRFISEEQLLLKENGASPSCLDLIKKINDLENKLQLKENAINDLKSALSNL